MQGTLDFPDSTIGGKWSRIGTTHIGSYTIYQYIRIE